MNDAAAEALEHDEALVGAAFVSWHVEPSPDAAYEPMTEDEARAAFDSFVLRVRAAAWDEGFDAGHYIPGEARTCSCRSNPYQEQS